MRLYLFEHCSICFRVRMTAALKRLHLQETVVPEDDSDTMTRLVGKRVVPILVKDDGQPPPTVEAPPHLPQLRGPMKVGSASTDRSIRVVLPNRAV